MLCTFPQEGRLLCAFELLCVMKARHKDPIVQGCLFAQLTGAGKGDLRREICCAD